MLKHGRPDVGEKDEFIFYHSHVPRKVYPWSDWGGRDNRSLSFKKSHAEFGRFDINSSIPNPPYLYSYNSYKIYPLTPGAVKLVEIYAELYEFMKKGPICMVLNDNQIRLKIFENKEIFDKSSLTIRFKHAIYLGLTNLIRDNLKKFKNRVNCSDPLNCMIHTFYKQKIIHRNHIHFNKLIIIEKECLPKSIPVRYYNTLNSQGYYRPVIDAITSAYKITIKQAKYEYFNLFDFEDMTLDEAEKILSQDDEQKFIQHRVRISIETQEDMERFIELSKRYSLSMGSLVRIRVVRLRGAWAKTMITDYYTNCHIPIQE